MFCVYFFRDPETDLISDPSFIIAPGQGRILELAEESNIHMGGPSRVVKIFLSIFDIHVQRSPISGKVVRVEYKKGKFLDARNPIASFENEQNSIVIENEYTKVVVKQIAGFIARRIICWVRPGQEVKAGQRIGLIRFGSQVDLFLPKEIELCVERDETVSCGVSVIAYLTKHQMADGRAVPTVKTGEGVKI